MKTEDADYRHIEQSYDQGSDDYSGHFKEPHAFIEADRQEFIRQLPHGAQILDCGCGPGMDTEKFFQLGYQVTAIDLSESFVRLTKTRVPGATVQKMDMRFLEFPPASFHGLWASFSVLHVLATDLNQTLFGFKQVLTRWTPSPRVIAWPIYCYLVSHQLGGRALSRDRTGAPI